jgi:uncharacterized lipoprotein YmbA
MRSLNLLFVAMLAALLTGCAGSSNYHYYTLLPASSGGVQSANARPAAPEYVISVQDVSLPEQLDRLQIVLTETNSTQVVIMNNYLWASPLSDELRNALSDRLSNRLGVLDVTSAGVGDKTPIWKIGLDVQRFESVYAEYALLEASWRLMPSNLPKSRSTICRASTRVPVQESMTALVAGHQVALQRLADVMATQLQTGRVGTTDDLIDFKGCSAV